MKMVQAGKLIGIEEALGSLGKQPVAAITPVAKVSPAPQQAPPASKPIAPPAPKPSTTGDWRADLHSAMTSAGLAFSADAIAQAEVALVNNELQITAPKHFQLDLGREEILTALKQLGQQAQRFKVIFGEAKTAAAPLQKPVQKSDEATARALAHPEVQKARELFGGEVRTVRNLKENE